MSKTIYYVDPEKCHHPEKEKKAGLIICTFCGNKWKSVGTIALKFGRGKKNIYPRHLS